jgi:hypothetical protein
MDPYIDKLTVGQPDDIPESFSKLFNRTGIPFRVAESKAMKDLINKLRSAFSDFIPSAATIGNSLLTNEYDRLLDRGKTFLLRLIQFMMHLVVSIKVPWL